ASGRHATLTRRTHATPTRSHASFELVLSLRTSLSGTPAMGSPAHGMTEWRARHPGGPQEILMSKSSDPSMAPPRSGSPAAGRNLSQLLPVEPATKPSIHILVADDERTLRESCASVLGVEGYNVTVTGKGDEALDLLQRRTF